MGRRSSHTADELREVILASATQIIIDVGLAGLSARVIARSIGYSPGTIYNVFSDLDHLVLTIEERLLDDLAATLAAVSPADDPVQHLCDLARAYLAFAQRSPRLWNLLFEHHMPNGWMISAIFRGKLEEPLRHVELACIALIGDANPERIKRTSRALWAAVHGVASLATAQKLSTVNPDEAWILVEDLVRTYAQGLKVHHAAARKRKKD